MNRRLGWALVIATASLLVAVYATGLGGGLGNTDEAVYAEFIRAMHRTGDHGTLRYQDTVLLQRPAISVAMYAITARIVPGEYGIRLLPMLFTLVTIVVIGAAVWRGSRDVQLASARLVASVAAAIFLAGIASVYIYGRLVLSDPPFVLASILALWATMAAQRDLRWLPWAGLALGAAFGVKSLAAGIPAAALTPWLLRAIWRHRGTLRWRVRVVGSAVGFLLLAAPFYVIGFARHGETFWDQHIARIIVDRAAGDLETLIGIGGPSAYLRHLWLADGPVVAVVLLGSIVAAAVLGVMRRDSELGVAATYASVVLLGLTAVNTRLAHYLLVFYPGAALCAGLLTSRIITWADEASSLKPWLVRGVAPVLALSLFATTIAQDPFDPSAYPSPAAETLGAAVQRHAAPDQPIYTFDWYAPALGYYGDRVWHSLVGDPEMARALGNSDPFRYTGTVHAVPPWPEGRFLVAADPRRLARVKNLRMTVLAETEADDGDGTFVLVEAEMRE